VDDSPQRNCYCRNFGCELIKKEKKRKEKHCDERRKKRLEGCK